MRAYELYEDVKSLEKQLQDKYPDIDTLFLSLNDSTIRLSSIIINPQARKTGVGTQVMQDLVNYADQHQYRITLTPGHKDDRHGTTSTARLIKFYKQFGFVQNKGRNKDFAISDSMYRDPS